MANTPILDIVQVGANQNQKETTINTAIAVIEAACNDVKAFSGGGNRTLTKAEFTRNFHMRFTGVSTTATVTVPATPRFFALSNEGSGVITVKTAATSGLTVTVEAGIRALLISDGTNIHAVTSGMGQSGGFGAFAGMGDVTAGQVLRYDGAAWGPADVVVEHAFFFAGAPTANQLLYRKVTTQPERLFSDFNGSRGVADAAPTSTAALAVFKNGAQVGTITFAVGQTQPTFSTNMGPGSTSISLLPGDVLSVRAPATATALADAAVTLKGVIL